MLLMTIFNALTNNLCTSYWLVASVIEGAHTQGILQLDARIDVSIEVYISEYTHKPPTGGFFVPL